MLVFLTAYSSCARNLRLRDSGLFCSSLLRRIRLQIFYRNRDGTQVAVDKEKQWNAYSTGGPRFGGMGSVTSSTISNGSLVVDMYDPTSKQLVWTGTATKTLNPSSNQEKNQHDLDKAVAKLLKNYPPSQKK
jgi:hypothetical protein